MGLGGPHFGLELCKDLGVSWGVSIHTLLGKYVVDWQYSMAGIGLMRGVQISNSVTLLT